MGDVHANIKPTALNQRELVDALYMLFYSLYTLLTKLDADSGVPSATYVANCWTALVNVIIYNSKGSRTGQGISASSSIEQTQIIRPNGLSDKALLAAIFQYTNAWETLCEQLDGDSLTLTNYEATAYTACHLHRVRNEKGTILGNGSTFMFHPAGVRDQRQLVEWLYNAFNGVYQLCTDQTTTGLDGDATVNDTNYAALIYTAILTLMVQNAAGSQIGIARKK